MVALVSNDPVYKYYPVLRANYGENGRKMLSYIMVFHRPKMGMPLEIIR